MSTLVRVVAALGLTAISWLLRGTRSRREDVSAPMVRLAVRHPWLIVMGMAAAALIAMTVVVISGIAPINASSGHWRITAALLDFAKVRSVSTHAWGITPPPLEDPALIERGAGHYETACVSCHGAPGRSIAPVARAMTPAPPALGPRLTRWTPAQLFTIVQHGIKFTGMPAWPVPERDDEVWAVVAFLRRMPGLDTAGYRGLVYGAPNPLHVEQRLPPAGDLAPPRPVRDVCWRCHGTTGTGRSSGAFPSLAAQRARYLDRSLRAFRDGSRRSGIMTEVAARLSDDQIRDVSAYYERLAPRAPTIADATRVQRGQAVAMTGVPDRDVPACVECHGPAIRPKNPAYPTLTAQHVPYLISQLRLLRDRRRGGTANVDLMHVFVSRLRDDEIRDVAAYFASLPGDTAAPPAPSPAVTEGPRLTR